MKNGGKLSTFEIKVQALEADKGTCTSEAPAEPAKRKRRTSLCLQVCQAKHCEKFRTLINNSWPILQTSVTFPAHASIEMYGVKFIFEYHKSGKVAI